MAGAETDMPPAKDLLDAGVQSLGSEEEKDRGLQKDPATQIDSLISKPENEGSSSSQPPTPLVAIGTGLPALPKKLIARVLAHDYIDLAELPPAKGKGRPMPQSLEGQIIVIQAAELM